MTSALSARQESPVKALADEYQRFRIERNPLQRLREGLPVTELPDLSLARKLQDAEAVRRILDGLLRIDERSLSHEDWLTLRILRSEVDAIIAEPRHHWLEFAVLPYSTPIRATEQLFTLLPVRDADQRVRYLLLLRQYPRFVGRIRYALAEQQRRGIVIPRDELDLVAPFLAADLGAAATGFGVADQRLPGVPAQEAKRFQAAVAAVVSREIEPALRALAADLGDAYRRHAPATVGLSQYPGGRDAYAHLVRRHTTLDVTPQQVHEIGLAEVERIDGEMARVRERLGFKGGKAEFHRFLRTDPRFFPKTPEEIGEKLMAAMTAIEPALGRLFLRRPKAEYGVRRLDPRLEGSMTYGYYQVPTPADAKGYYNYNGSTLDQRSLLNVRALAYHELAPGHHFQINLQTENMALPAFRRQTRHTPYTEGWGEYASSLGGELGLFSDPYDEYGRLMMDMFLSVRLVVDTGMNALGWSRDRATAYMREHTLESEEQIRTETLRYAVDMPGQALAYKMGSRTFRELRAEAERALGSRFDVRRFHEAVLGSGSMPMTVLREHVAWWITQVR